MGFAQENPDRERQSGWSVRVTSSKIRKRWYTSNGEYATKGARFGSFRLDLKAGEVTLRKHVRLCSRNQPLQVLRILGENEGTPGSAARRSEKRRCQRHHRGVRAQHQAAINKLRKVLGDTVGDRDTSRRLARRGLIGSWCQSMGNALPVTFPSRGNVSVATMALRCAKAGTGKR